MTHNDVYEQFKKTFPFYASQIEEWFPNGKRSIRIRLVTGQDFIFTYNGPEELSFETMEMFLKRIS